MIEPRKICSFLNVVLFRFLVVEGSLILRLAFLYPLIEHVICFAACRHKALLTLIKL